MAVQIIQTIEELVGLEKILEEPVVACDLEASDLDTRICQLEGIGLGTSQKQGYIAFSEKLSPEQVRPFLREVFEKKLVIFHNAKYDLQVFDKYKIDWPERIHDTMIMAWLVDENVSHSLKSLAQSIFGREVKRWEQVRRTPDLFYGREELTQELANYCAGDVRNTFDLYEYFLPLLQKGGLIPDYERIELKLIPVLTRMECRGVRIDTDWLEQKKGEIELILKDLERELVEKTGDSKVNIHSPRQLEYFLFDVLKYPASKITGAGKRSTDDEVLKDLVKELNLQSDDFIPLLLKFRELDKLYRTYIVGLLGQVDENQVIHTNFLQHGTRTGRLASSDPNLQNIPLRSDEWNIRQAFIPREGYKFLIADYSQIELRMLAHFSQDKNMVEVFEKGGDIHAKTMELTGTKRKEAKGINFGLIYGMGSRTLAHILGIKEEQAKEYIERFFAGYPGVRPFSIRIQQRALREGIVEMLTGRKRRFYEIKDARWYNAIKRQAINTVISGSAADLIKVAMIRLAKALESFDAHQLIQIHDEIVMEVPREVVGKVKAVVKDTMENALKLRVPLQVGIEEGDYWLKS
jgi:DNA polymerase-1